MKNAEELRRKAKGLDSAIRLVSDKDIRIETIMSFMEQYATIREKETSSKAFIAGEEYAKECYCGECHYCKEIKRTDAPNFDEWYTKHKEG